MSFMQNPYSEWLYERSLYGEDIWAWVMGPECALFDQLAARNWGSDSSTAQGGSGVLSTQSSAIRDYLPSVLRLLRDADNAQESCVSQELATIVEKLMEIAMRYQTADAIEEYLCVASEVCKAKLKAYTPGPTPSLAPSTPGVSAANGAAGSGAREEKKASKNTVLLFESGSAMGRVRLVLDELLTMVTALTHTASRAAAKPKDSTAQGEALDILNRTSFGQELKLLVPVLTAYAPVLSLRLVARGLTLHCKLASAFLVTLVQNESLCLPAVLRGIVEAVSDAESLGAKEAQVLQRAEETCVKLAELSTAVATEVRLSLVSHRQLPQACLDISQSQGDVLAFLSGLGGGAHDWFWETVDALAVVRVLAHLSPEARGLQALDFDKAVALSVAALEERLPWEQMRPLWDPIHAAASAQQPTGSYRPLLALLLLLLGYTEGLHESHEAITSFIAALSTLLRTGAAVGWQDSQGCVPLHVALLLTGGPPRTQVLIDCVLTPQVHARPPDYKYLALVMSACQSAASLSECLELTEPWFHQQLSCLPSLPWPVAPSDPLHCLVEAYEQGVATRRRLQLREWLLALLRTQPFPEHVACHPHLPALLDHYAASCITDPAVCPPLPHELQSLASPWDVPGPLPPLTLSSLLRRPVPSPTRGSRRRRRVAPPPGHSWLGHYVPQPLAQTHTAPPLVSPAPAMCACLLALRLHRLFLGHSKGPFDSPLDWDLASLPLSTLLHHGYAYRSLQLGLLALSADALPELFLGPSNALLPDDRRSAGQPWDSPPPGPTPLGHRPPCASVLPPPCLLPWPCVDFPAYARSVLEALTWLLSSAQASGGACVLLHGMAVERAWSHVYASHPQPWQWQARTLETLLAAGGHDPYLITPGLLTRRTLAQEALLVLRTAPWALRHAAVLRIALTLLRAQLAASRLEVAYAWRGSLLRAELMNKSQSERAATAPDAATPQRTGVGGVSGGDGPGLCVLQEAMAAKCLLALAADPHTGLEVRQECCAFVQDLVLISPRVLPLLAHRGLEPSEMVVLLDGVPAAVSQCATLPSLVQSCSLVAQACALGFMVEVARRYPHDDMCATIKQTILSVVSRLSPTQMQVCLMEGEEVLASFRTIANAVLAFVVVFPATKMQIADVFRGLPNPLELDASTRTLAITKDVDVVLRQLSQSLDGPLEGISPR